MIDMQQIVAGLALGLKPYIRVLAGRGLDIVEGQIFQDLFA